MKNGKLDILVILFRFIKIYNQVVKKLTDRFKEGEGREYFLLYLKPIINDFYIEAQTKD